MLRLRINFFLLLTIFILFQLNCRETKKSPNDLLLDPPLGTKFQFHILKTGIDKWEEKLTYDTLKLTLQLNCIKKFDSFNLFRMEFKQAWVFKPKSLAYIDSSEWLSMWKSIIGKTYSIEIAKNGEVLSVIRPGSFVDSIASKLKMEPYVFNGRTFDYVGEGAIKDLLSVIFAYIPRAKPIKGEIWACETLQASKAPINIDNLFQLDESKDDSALVSFKSTLQAGLSENPWLKGTQTGTVVGSYSTGIPYRLESMTNTLYITKYYSVESNIHLEIHQ